MTIADTSDSWEDVLERSSLIFGAAQRPGFGHRGARPALVVGAQGIDVVLGGDGVFGLFLQGVIGVLDPALPAAINFVRDGVLEDDVELLERQAVLGRAEVLLQVLRIGRRCLLPLRDELCRGCVLGSVDLTFSSFFSASARAFCISRTALRAVSTLPESPAMPAVDLQAAAQDLQAAATPLPLQPDGRVSSQVFLSANGI